MIISIFASIGSQNLGDELILKNEINLLEDKYSSILNVQKKEIQFNVFTYDLEDIFYKKDSVKYIEYFPINIKNPKNIFRNIKNFFNFIKITIKSDLIVIGGGGIFYDNENQSVGNPLKQWLFRTNIFKVFRKKVEFFRVGINIKNKNNLETIKKIFSCASDISVRDNYSFDLLNKLNFKNIILEKDPVFFDRVRNLTINNSILNSFSLQEKEAHFYLEGKLDIKYLNVQNIKNLFQQGGFNPLYISGKKIGLSLRDYNVEKFEEKIIEIIKYFLENNAEIILIPHSFHKTDIRANDYVFLKKCRDVSLKHLNVNPDKITICTNMQESYEIYTEKKIDLNLASRLHSIILSQVYEIPFIAISYSTKTDEIISQLSNQNQDI